VAGAETAREPYDPEMSAPAGPPGHDGAEVAGPPAGRRRGTRTTLAVLGVLAVLAGGGLALSHGTDTAPPAAAALRPLPTPTVGSDPGTLILSTTAIDLGTTGVRADFDLANVGDLATQYQVFTHTPWLRLSSIGGSLGATDSARVTVAAVRSAVPAGITSGTVVVTWDGGSARIRVSLGRTPAS